MTDSTITINHPRPRAESILVSPLHCRWGFSKHEMNLNMQNKPNLELNASSLISTNGSRDTAHESRFMQNKPNLQKTYVLESTKTNPISTSTHRPNAQTVQISTQKSLTFPVTLTRFCSLSRQKALTFRRFLQVSDIDTLNSIHSKDLHKYYTCLRRI